MTRPSLGHGLRKQHTCQIRTTSSLDSPLCGAPATEQRADVRLWVCAEHQYFGADRDPVTTPRGVWPANRRHARIGHWR